MDNTNKEAFIQAVKEADITSDVWLQEIVDSINDKYARGYIDGTLENMSESISSGDEEFRERLLTIADYNIWRK